MTDRGLPQSDAATACPFVAFEDDRDERSDRPDHRHRCYADVHPAPRAIAHQEAYCLSAAFAVCPTFQDWAQREAARARGSGATGTGAGHAARDVVAERGAQADADAAAGAARAAADDRERERVINSDTGVIPAAEWQGSRPGRDDDGPPALPPRRNPPRDWAAPPPWAGGAGGPPSSAGAGGAGSPGGAAAGPAGLAAGAGLAGAAAGRDRDSGEAPPPFLADRESRGLAGSAADRLAGGDPDAAPGAERPERTPVRPDPFVPSRSNERAQAADDELAALVRRRDADRDRVEPRDDDTGRLTVPAAAAGGALGTGASRRPPPAPRNEDDAPSWEQPRRYEAYPTIKTRSSMGGLPRLAVMAAALAIAALALFLLPAALNWFGDSPGSSPGAGASAEPSASSVAATASPQPTTPAAPTPQIYVIKSGDTLSKIAQQFNVSLDDLLEANRENIPDPDKISIGDQVIIPVPEPDTLPDASAAPPAP